MAELDFALDGLYAAGWWPEDGDDCRQSPDHRWYPSPETILNAFSRQSIDLVISMPLCGHPVTVRWHSVQGGLQTVTARTQTEALILAYTRSFVTCRRTRTGRDAPPQAISSDA